MDRETRRGIFPPRRALSASDGNPANRCRQDLARTLSRRPPDCLRGGRCPCGPRAIESQHTVGSGSCNRQGCLRGKARQRNRCRWFHHPDRRGRHLGKLWQAGGQRNDGGDSRVPEGNENRTKIPRIHGSQGQRAHRFRGTIEQARCLGRGGRSEGRGENCYRGGRDVHPEQGRQRSPMETGKERTTPKGIQGSATILRRNAKLLLR
mmetsp:Transcript_18093/g.37116  ORF Transcript_18093/g.37116 Transcript_18093/m.37116 type:complete len:207 (-) Transcript_18093:168-788(-)